MKYEVEIEGKNFLIKVDGKVQRMGFFRTVLVDAKDTTEAEEMGLTKVREDLTVQNIVVNTKQDSPMMYVRRVESREGRSTGYSWFEM